jgi:hypothetical protein
MAKENTRNTFFKFLYESQKHEPGQFNNWRPLSTSEAHTEYEREVPKTTQLGKLWNDHHDFAAHVASSPVEEIPHHVHQDMDYASHHDSIDDLKHLTSQYRFPRDVDSITRGYHEHASMPTPIVLKHTLDGEHAPQYRVMSGNTRLAAAEVLGVPRKATVLDVTDRLRKTGRRF